MFKKVFYISVPAGESAAARLTQISQELEGRWGTRFTPHADETVRTEISDESAQTLEIYFEEIKKYLQRFEGTSLSLTPTARPRSASAQTASETVYLNPASYKILMTLRGRPSLYSLTAERIATLAQANPAQIYDHLKTLIDHGLLRGDNERPRRYTLTDTGREGPVVNRKRRS